MRTNLFDQKSEKRTSKPKLSGVSSQPQEIREQFFVVAAVEAAVAVAAGSWRFGAAKTAPSTMYCYVRGRG